ncbi:MAG: HAD family hydrolase [Candidatus Micrarchaeota archaeon]|nr:HAD family hydrolase [Candidatus Micrarchaeota archaeon]
MAKKVLNGIKVVVSDWSGVVSDDRKPVYEANMRVLESHGMQRLTPETFFSTSTMTPMEFYSNLGIKGSPDVLFEKYKIEYSKVKAEGLAPVPYPDAKEVIGFLASKVKLIVVSSHPKEHLVAEAAEYGVKANFSNFFGNARDKSTAILHALQNQNIHPSQVVYIGDTIYDIRAAKKADVNSVGITTGYHAKERLMMEDPNLVVDSLTEFAAAVRN